MRAGGGAGGASQVPNRRFVDHFEIANLSELGFLAAGASSGNASGIFGLFEKARRPNRVALARFANARVLLLPKRVLPTTGQ